MPAGKEVEAAGPLGEPFEAGFWKDFSLRFAFTAMQVCVLAEFLCFGTVLDFILRRLQGQGASVSEVYPWVVFDYALATWVRDQKKILLASKNMPRRSK